MSHESRESTGKFAVADLQALTAFDTPTIANALETLEVEDVQWLGPAIRSLAPIATPIVGVAVTATMSEQRGGKFDHFGAWQEFCAAIEQTPLPVIAVFHDASQRPGREAMIGEGMSRAMRASGAVGVICDGCVRDIKALREMAFPVWGAGLTAHRGRIRFHQFQVPVRLGEMAVKPGDLIHADENGAVIVPAALAARTADAAREVAKKESRYFAMLERPAYTVADLRAWYRALIESDRGGHAPPTRAPGPEK